MLKQDLYICLSFDILYLFEFALVVQLQMR